MTTEAHNHCQHCGERLAPRIRPGPSGTFRVGGTPVLCRRCGGTTHLATRDLLPLPP